MEQYSLAYVYNSLPKQCREIAALLFLLSINIAVNASELSFTLNTNGIDFLSYHGQTLASSGGMVIGVADFIEADGGSYQSNVISTIWLPMESNKVRVIVDWGSVSCVYTQYSDSINMTLTVSNSTINTMRVARIVVQYLSVPNASQTKVWTFDPGQFYGSEGPFTLGSSAYGAGGGYGIPLIHCEYQTGCFAIGQAVFPDTEEDVGNSDTYVMVSNVSNKLSCTVCIYYIAPGSVKTRNFCLRFAPSGTDPYIVPNYISDLFEKYNAFKPMVFQWDDRRPILGETTLANGTITNQNPRRYTTSYDLRTEAGKAAFRTQLLQRADTTISKMREGNAQGIIIWSIEGIERKESMYIGDPRRIEFAPEMEYKGTSTVATVDAFLKKFTDAGFRIGHCLRPRELVDKTYELGMQFKPLRNGVITRLRLRPSFQDRYDVHIARIWRNEDDVVIGGPYYLSFGGATYPGGSDDWMEFEIPDVEVFSNVEYTLSIALSTNGCCAFSYYPMNSTNWIDNGSNLMYRGGGVYSTNLGVRPTIVHSNFYYRDIVFIPEGGGEETCVGDFQMGFSSKPMYSRDPSDRAALLIDMISYCKNRWGSTLYYIDSSVTSDGGALKGEIYKRVQAAHPDVLLMPENQCADAYAYTAPVDSGSAHYVFKTPKNIKLIWRGAFTGILAPFVASYSNQYAMGVSQGDIPFFYEWETASISNFYKGGVKIPPTSKIIGLTNGSTLYVNAPIEIHGEANDPDGTIQKVEFYYSTVAGGLTYLGEDATAPYNFVCSNLPVGRFVLSIKAIDSDGLENWSAQVAIRILPVDASPYFSPIAGTYREPLEVTISSISSNAAIYYTLDGSVPSYTNGTLYQQPVVVTNNTIISAVSYIDGLPVGNVVTGRYNVRCSSPWFEPWPGTYDYFPFVSITSDVGYTVYYTVDGSTPSITNGMLFTNSIFIITNTTLKAVCYNENMEPSVVTRGDYIIRCKTPILLPAGGTYNTEQSVTISSLTYNATIIYTTDGTIPSQTNGLIYTNSVKISSNTVIKAMATRYDLADSLNTSGTYYIRCVQPVFIPPQGTYSDTISVSIATTTENATIKYTIDGTTPNQTNGIIYSAPIAITTNSTTLKAVAYKTGMSNSPVASGNYILKCAPPLFSLPGGTYTVDQITVAITSITPYASIYYTLDGSLPSQSNGFLYVSPIIIRTNTILKALAYRENFSNSVLSSADYYLRCATPLFSHISGIYTNGIELGISCGSTGADIYYTLDGSIPSRSNGVLYSGSVEIRSNVIVKAIGVKDWMMDSDVASCVYTVRCARPMFNPVCGVYTAGQNISISSETAGVEIRYTVDGSIPSSSNGIVYSGGVWLESNVVLRAIAYSEGKMDSEVREMRYYFVGGGGVSNISLWVGGEDNLWGDGSNWLGGIVPGINDYAVFPGWATRKYIDLGGVKRFVRGMIFSDDGGGYSISNGGLVVISNIVQDGVGGVSILSEVGLGGDVGVYGYGSGVVEVYGSVTGASRNIYVDLTNSVLRLYGTNNYQNMYITNGWLGVYGINENTGSSVLTLRGLGRKVIDIGVSNRMPFGGVGGNFRWDLYGGSVVVRSGISNGVELSNYLDVGSGVGDIYSEASNGVSFNFARINGGSAYMRFNVNVSTMRVGYLQSGGDGGGYFVKNGGGCLYVGGGSNVGRCDLFYMKEGRLVIDIDTNSYFAWRFGSGLISNVDSEVVLSRGGEYRITANRWEHNGFSRCVVTSLVEGVVLRDRVVLYGGVGRTGALEIGSSVGWNMVGLTLSGNGYLDVRSRRVSVGGIGQAGNSYLYKLGGGGLELIGGGVSYIGGVIVRGGEFIVNGYCSNIVSVYSGGLVGGTGYIYKCVVYSNGVFGGGDSGIGMIIVSNITFEGGGIYEWEYGGGGGDSVKVLNNLVMGTGMVFRLMHLSGGIDTNDELVLFEYGGNNPVLVNSRIEYVGNWVNTNGVISVDTGRKRVVFSGGEAEPYMVSCVEFNPGGGVYTGMVDVFMSSTTTNAVIVYTVDGSEPSYTNGIIYTNAVLITSNTELKAFAYKDWMTPSPTTSAWYYVEGGNQKTLLSPLFQKKHNNTSHIDGIVVRESFLDNTYKTSLPVLPPSYVSVSKGTFTNRIHINWNAIAGSGIRYEIWRSIYERTNEAIKVSTENINDTNYYDLSVEPFTTYYYWIRTVKDNNEFISPFSVADYGYCGTVGPLILLNGKIGTIVITNDEPLTIAFQIMNVPDELNYLTEWWGLLYSYQNKKYYYFDSSMNWIECYNLSREPQPCYTGRLINIDPIVVLEISVMPAGMYDVWFIIDAVVDGKLLDASCVLYDKATIIVQYNRE